MPDQILANGVVSWSQRRQPSSLHVKNDEMIMKFLGSFLLWYLDKRKYVPKVYKYNIYIYMAGRRFSDDVLFGPQIDAWY